MATTFVDGVTPLDATAFNGIEDEIADLTKSVTSLESIYVTSSNALINAITAKNTNTAYCFGGSSSVSSFLTNEVGNGVGIGVIFYFGTSSGADYIYTVSGQTYLYWGRLSVVDGTVTRLRRVTGTTIISSS